MIPGLENAAFQRYGVMHRNTYIYSPGILDDTYALRDRATLRFAGQMTGVEGYVESASSGFIAGLNAARDALSLPRIVYGSETAMGALAKYVSNEAISEKRFQPMNANFGIMDPLGYKVKGGKQEKNRQISARALLSIDAIAKELLAKEEK